MIINKSAESLSTLIEDEEIILANNQVSNNVG